MFVKFTGYNALCYTGYSSFLDDDEEKNKKMNAVTCPLSTEDIEELLQSAYSQLLSNSKDTDLTSHQPEIKNRRLDEATATAVSALRMHATMEDASIDTGIRSRAKHRCVSSHKERKKAEIDEPEQWSRFASAKTYAANYQDLYATWSKNLYADPSKQPYEAQTLILQVIHNRCVLEHQIESADISEQASKQAAAEPPLFRLIHGLPGSGKSQVLKWLRSYFNEVWLWTEGVHYQFLAPLNSMADNIGGATVCFLQ